MKLKSRGLGRKELVMDFREYDAHVEDGELVITGTIHEPVTWDFTIRMCQDDVPGVARLALRPATLRVLLGALVRPRRRDHWSNGRVEHRAQIRARRRERRAGARSEATPSEGVPRPGRPRSEAPSRGEWSERLGRLEARRGEAAAARREHAGRPEPGPAAPPTEAAATVPAITRERPSHRPAPRPAATEASPTDQQARLRARLAEMERRRSGAATAPASESPAS